MVRKLQIYYYYVRDQAIIIIHFIVSTLSRMFFSIQHDQFYQNIILAKTSTMIVSRSCWTTIIVHYSKLRHHIFQALTKTLNYVLKDSQKYSKLIINTCTHVNKLINLLTNFQCKTIIQVPMYNIFIETREISNESACV